jgi:hypothetical protein
MRRGTCFVSQSQIKYDLGNECSQPFCEQLEGGIDDSEDGDHFLSMELDDPR